MTEFQKNLKKIRELRRLTQEELAQKSGISQSAISKYEHGLESMSKPKLETLEALARALDCKIRELDPYFAELEHCIGITEADATYGCPLGDPCPFSGNGGDILKAIFDRVADFSTKDQIAVLAQVDDMIQRGRAGKHTKIAKAG